MRLANIALLILAAATTAGDEGGGEASVRTRGCGEISVQLLCYYYDLPFHREEVLKVLQPGKMGEVSVARMCEALEGAGLRCQALRGTFDSIRETRAPLIVFAKVDPDDTIGHFAVALYNESSGAVTVFDPLVQEQPLNVSEVDFMNVWTGVAISASPPPKDTPDSYWYVAIGAASIICGAILGRSLSTGRH
jgi:ABC-type bacteriocin/lantibiotic exporter with double-glycine peptidase domain